MPTATSLVKETITIQQVGPYGVRVSESTWYGINEPLAPSDFEKGKTYEVLVKKLTKKSYIAQIVNDQIAPVSTAVMADTKAAIAALPVVHTENEAKNQRILYQGVLQAVTQSPHLAGLKDFADQVENLTDRFVKFIESRTN